MSGSITISPGYSPVDGEKMTNAKFRLLGAPIGQVGAGQITATELSTSVNTALSQVASSIKAVTDKAAGFTVLTSDAGTLFSITTGASDVTVVLPAAVTAGNGWSIWLKKVDSGSGTILTTPAAMPNALVLSKQDHRALVYCDGTNYFAMPFLTTLDSAAAMVIWNAGAIQLLAPLINIGPAVVGNPAFKASGSTFAFRLGNDSADCGISAASGVFSKAIRNSATINLGNLATSKAIDWSLGNSFYGVMTAATTFTFSNAHDGQVISLFLPQNGTGGFTPTWPNTINWAGTGHTAPAPTTTANMGDIYHFEQINGLIFGRIELNFG